MVRRTARRGPRSRLQWRTSLVVLLLCAIANLAVSLVCAMWSPLSAPEPIGREVQWRGLESVADRATLLEIRKGLGVRQQVLVVMGERYDERGTLRYWIDGAWRPAIGVPDFVSRRYAVHHAEAGFPFPALAGIRYTAVPYATSGRTIRGDRGVSASPARRILPVRPYGLGFAANTTVYFVAAWLVRAVAVQVRGDVRRRRGRCARCGHGVGPALVCTECGTLVSRPSA